MSTVLTPHLLAHHAHPNSVEVKFNTQERFIVQFRDGDGILKHLRTYDHNAVGILSDAVKKWLEFDEDPRPMMGVIELAVPK